MASPCAAKLLLSALFAGLAAPAGAIRALRQPQGGKVRVELFYETMCPYCHQLINNTLMPLWNDPEMRQAMDLRLLPAGNVMVLPTENISKGYVFWHPEVAGHKHVFRCQHGESECLGNLIHSCAIKLLAEPEKYMPLIFCMAERTNHMPEKSSFECMEELGVDPEPIRNCVLTPEADDDMFTITQVDKSISPARQYVPWVMVDGNHIEVNDGKADLKQAICDVLGDKAPAGCPPPKVTSALAASAAMLAAKGQELAMGAEKGKTNPGCQLHHSEAAKAGL
mmetsp:Transcript_47458/g.113895  ORF Transcript_47458/g.113895 Transcript_47458/m.113895 type:complete len:281 (+) Transcript_47458:113-955(+)